MAAHTVVDWEASLRVHLVSQSETWVIEVSVQTVNNSIQSSLAYPGCCGCWGYELDVHKSFFVFLVFVGCVPEKNTNVRTNRTLQVVKVGWIICFSR